MGAFEEAKGKVKEAAGDITDNADLKQEGRAQKEKGEAEREATQARAKAKAHDAKAKEKELEQEAAEKPSRPSFQVHTTGPRREPRPRFASVEQCSCRGRRAARSPTAARSNRRSTPTVTIRNPMAA